MNQSLLQVELLINDLPLSIENVWFHYQEIPHPGRNSYRLRVSSSEIILSDYFETLECSMTNLQRRDSEKFMLNLSLLLNENGTSLGVSKIEFVLNRIDSISISVNEIIVEGICSKFIKIAQ